MTRWTSITLVDGLGENAADWDRLNDKLFGKHPLLSSLFIDGLLRNFGDGKERLFVVKAGNDIAAMCILRPCNRLKWESFLPPQAQIAPTLVADSALLASLVPSLPHGVLQLDLLSNDPAFGAVLDGDVSRRMMLNHALTMQISLEGTFAAYWGARSKQLQSNVKKREKRLAEDGIEARRLTIADPAQIVEAVDRFATLEGSGWKGRNGTALGSTPAQHQFYRDLMRCAAACGNAYVAELWFDGTLAASRLLLKQSGMVVILKTSYDEQFAAYSPGRLQLRDVIEQAFEQHPGECIEFYTDADQNQLEWATAQRWIKHRTMYRSPLAEAMSILLRIARKSGNDTHERTVQSFSHPDVLPADVKSFMLKAEKRNMSFGLAWYQNLVDTVFMDSVLRFYVLRNGDQILAVMPLKVEQSASATRLSSLSNFYTSLYEPILDPGLKSSELVPILSKIDTEFPRAASLTLSPMAPDGHAYQTLLGAIRLQGWIGFEYFAFGNWYQQVQERWEAYLTRRDSTLQNTLRRMSKKFGSNGGTLEIITQTKDTNRGIEAYQQVYAASWKQQEAFPAFTPGLLHTYAAKGFLRLGLAWLDGKPVAAQLWIVSHGRAEIYKLAYHPDYKSYSPGTLLTAKLFEHVMDVDKVGEIDYLIGDDQYKRSWMSNRRERWGIIAYNPLTLMGFAGAAREAMGRLLKVMHSRRRTQQPSGASQQGK